MGGLEDNGICDSGAQMLLDAIRQNTTLQTLKLSRNNIQVQSTVRSINELLGNNREAGKKKESKRGEKSKSRRSERKSSRRVGDENACERKDRRGRKEGLDGKDRSKEKESS